MFNFNYDYENVLLDFSRSAEDTYERVLANPFSKWAQITDKENTFLTILSIIVGNLTLILMLKTRDIKQTRYTYHIEQLTGYIMNILLTEDSGRTIHFTQETGSIISFLSYYATYPFGHLAMGNAATVHAVMTILKDNSDHIQDMISKYMVAMLNYQDLKFTMDYNNIKITVVK